MSSNKSDSTSVVATTDLCKEAIRADLRSGPSAISSGLVRFDSISPSSVSSDLRLRWTGVLKSLEVDISICYD
jgi:hypothetical protein